MNIYLSVMVSLAAWELLELLMLEYMMQANQRTRPKMLAVSMVGWSLVGSPMKSSRTSLVVELLLKTRCAKSALQSLSGWLVMADQVKYMMYRDTKEA